MFTKIVESEKITQYDGMIQREAVRAIILSKNNLLLVRSDRGDYKFPGGGVEKNESHTEALVREVREETGYINCVVKDKVGAVIERKMDEFEHRKLFQMVSHYYLCELTNQETTHLQLDNYEADLKFSPTWVSIDAAIQQNESLARRLDQNSWLKREIVALKEVRKFLYRD